MSKILALQTLDATLPDPEPCVSLMSENCPSLVSSVGEA